MSLNLGEEKTGAGSSTPKIGKAIDLEQIRQTMAKRSLDVKFDLNESDYRPVENIGIGAYGVVCSAIHTKSGDRVAIKKIPCVFDALTIAKRTYREIKILKHFKHDNIICIREILKPKETIKDFKDIYVVFDLMESDLHRIIYSKQELSEEHVRYFLYQILRGLKYIHSANVIHRDLKPSNLLVNEDCHLRIGDFGMARGISYTPDEPSYFMTQYVATRWYRAPEILLSMLEYGTAVDMWSVGCIFAEMMGRKHLFPGKDYLTQVKLILGVLGTPSDKVMNNCQNDILKRIIKSFGKKNAVEWSKLFPKASKKSIDLLGKMLVLDPSERITPERALSHRLLNNYHDPDDEPICVPAFNFDFEKEDMDKKRLRSAIMEEVMCFHEPKSMAPALSFSAFLRPVPKDDPAQPTADVKQEKIQPSDCADKQTDNGGTVILQSQASLTSLAPSKPVPASLDTKFLGVIAPTDVEMLSAQSTMDVQEIQDFGSEIEEKLVAAEMEHKGDNFQQPSGEGKSSSVVKANDKKILASGNTISEDTKALVKQALMNATHRKQRAESQSEDKESKPVTAMQRQKEREEKRRKKKERALEKIKKNKKKKDAPQDASHLLSSQDVELLRRWTSMQNPAGAGQDSGSNSNSNSSPPHPGPSVSPASLNRSNSNSNLVFPGTSGADPAGNNAQVIFSSSAGIGFVGPGAAVQQVLPKPRQVLAKAASSGALPVTLSNPLRFSSAENTPGATVLIPSASQLEALGQANFIPVLAIPSATTPGKVEIKRILPQQQQKRQLKPSTSHDPALGSTSANRQASESTRTLLQSVLRERNQVGGPSSSVQTPVNISNSTTSTVAANFGAVVSASSREELNFTSGPSDASVNTGPQTVTTLPSHFPSQGQTDTSLTNPQPLPEPSGTISRQGGGITPLGSAGTNELMEFLDQLKDSSLKLKLASAGSSASLQTPPLSAFGQNSAGSLVHPEAHNPNIPSHGGVNVSSSIDGSSPSQDNHAGQSPGGAGQEQHLQRPSRSSLPFLSYSNNSLEQHHARPNRSSMPSTGYTASHTNTPDNQNIDSFTFTGFGDGSIDTSQQQASFPLSNYADSFIDAAQCQDPAPSYIQGFPSNEKLLQSQMLNYNQSSCQASDMFPSSSNYSVAHCVHPQQESINQKPQQVHYAQPRQQQLQDQLLFPYSSQASGASNPSFHQHQQTFSENLSGFRTAQQHHPQQGFSSSEHTFHQPNPGMSQAQPDSQLFGLPPQQQHISVMNPGPSTSGVPGSRSPNLTVDCRKEVSSAGATLHTRAATTSTATNNPSKGTQLPNQRQADLIALLSKQLSRAEVADIFPPALALTPRGTGAGYGVGMDLDSLLTDAQDGASHRGETSPLSSSLLADWLDISSNISQADLEALEREMALQSPMHVSFGDLGL